MNFLVYFLIFFIFAMIFNIVNIKRIQNKIKENYNLSKERLINSSSKDITSIGAIYYFPKLGSYLLYSDPERKNVISCFNTDMKANFSIKNRFEGNIELITHGNKYNCYMKNQIIEINKNNQYIATINLNTQTITVQGQHYNIAPPKGIGAFNFLSGLTSPAQFIKLLSKAIKTKREPWIIYDENSSKLIEINPYNHINSMYSRSTAIEVIKIERTVPYELFFASQILAIFCLINRKASDTR